MNQTSRNTNPRISTSTGVAHKTNVSRPQPRSNQMKDKVVPNNSECVFNANHDACVSTFLKDVNARTKKPNGVPITHDGQSISAVQFVEKYLGTVYFGNDQFAPILGYGDLVQGNITIKRVYYVEETTSINSNLSHAKASPPSMLLWHEDFLISTSTDINLLSKKDIVDCLPKTEVASINGKKYILVIVDDYSRYTWTLFLRSKDETPEVLKDFLTMIQRNLQAPVISVRTDRGTEFLNKTLNAFFKEEGIEH
ncbi:retrovirus-related pol polyprotein from transposon TNT 1-94 [Tanacetum coccineum]